jgi:HK97 family phage prohead protease
MKKSTKVFKVSDPSNNVYGFRVRTSGIRLEQFLENPVCLLNHNYDKVMGTWEDLTMLGTALTGVPVFDTEDPEAEKIYNKVEKDLIKGASIGILPIANDGDEITECELLEISVTPVPANRNALVIYNAERVQLNADEARQYLLSIQDNKNHDKKSNMNEKLRNALVALCVQAGLTIQLSADSKDEDAVTAIERVGNSITALKLSNVELKASNDRYKTAEDEAKSKEGIALVDAAIADKRTTADKRENWLKLFAADPELTKSTLEGLKPVTLSVIPGAEKAKETADDLKERESWTFDDYAEKASVDLAAMQTNDPEKFKKLYDAKVVKLKAAGAIA